MNQQRSKTMKTTVIITVKSKISGAYMRDTQELTASEIITVINDYITNDFEIVALEEIDETIEAFYSKRMTDADLDTMAEEAVKEYYNKPIIDAMAADIPE
tara:strand:- start:65 stop:367 length:303 start_codon:yes stop_codon:yes gene_type:complete